jgi:hypothetical protein
MSSTSGTLAITGAGLVCSLGARVEVACAAARAGLTQTTEGDFTVRDIEAEQMVPVTVHAVGALTLGFAELGRWVRLGSLALRDLLRDTPARGLERTAVLVNLPSDYLPRSAQQLEARPESPGVSYEALQPWYRAEYIPRLLRAAGLESRPAVQEVTFGDQAGAVTLLRTAAELLRTGRVTRCIVGGVDSLLEPRWLEASNTLRILKTATRPVGFMPGEGAAFLILEDSRRARHEERHILSTVDGLVLQQDRAHRFATPPPDGRVLSEVIRASLQQAPGPCAGYYGDLNGDTVRSQDWGMALVRLRPDHAPESLMLPALSFGETRAAYGFIAAAMGTQAFARGYAASDTLLVWAASDNGAKGSFTLTRHPPRGTR